VFESSKSAMNTLAPELSALMIILRSTGPVISTRRSRMSLGRRHRPLGFAHLPGFLKKVRLLASVKLFLPFVPRLEQRFAPRVEGALQIDDKRNRIRREDLLIAFAHGRQKFNAGKILQITHWGDGFLSADLTFRI